jgi:hypothetical protein
MMVAMFCPVCKAEYREGFRRCADCEVDLVHELPAEAIVARSSSDADIVDSDEDPFCSFWKGDDPRIHAELCDLLGNEGIPYKTFRRADHLFHISAKTSFEIGIPYSQFEKAEALVKEAYEIGEEMERRDGNDNRALPETVDPPK